MAEASNIQENKTKEPATRVVPDTISYQKMIPAFHFLVSFVDEVPDPKKKLKEEEVLGEDPPKDPKEEKKLDGNPVPFSEVGGLSLDLQTEDIIAGGDNGYTIRLPKPPKAKNLTLKRALAAAPPDIIDWARDALENFNFSTKTVIVSIVDFGERPVKTWNFKKAYPVKLAVSDLSASKNEIVIETLELAYQGFTLA